MILRYYKARIDALEALHHIIARGIARKKVFDDNADYHGYEMAFNRLCHALQSAAQTQRSSVSE